MVVTVFGMLRVVSLEQSAKALQSINVTLLGMLMEVNPLHPLKQSELIFSMPSGRVIDVNELLGRLDEVIVFRPLAEENL